MAQALLGMAVVVVVGGAVVVVGGAVVEVVVVTGNPTSVVEVDVLDVVDVLEVVVVLVGVWAAAPGTRPRRIVVAAAAAVSVSVNLARMWGPPSGSTFPSTPALPNLPDARGWWGVDEPVVTDNAEQRRYELTIGGQLVGVADYQPDGTSSDRLVFPHTEIDGSRRGQGLGAVLVKAALDDVRRQGKRVVPRCWYVAEFIDLNPAYRDLLADPH